MDRLPAMSTATAIPFIKIHKLQDLSPIVPDRKFVHELVINTVEGIFKEQGRIEPVWVISVGSELLWLKTPWESLNEKIITLKIINGFLEELKSPLYSFVSEAYAANLSNVDEEEGKELLKIVEEGGVAALPEDLRDDILLVHSYDRKGGSNHTRYKVTIRRKGLNFLGPRIDEDDDQYKGRMSNLFYKMP